MSTYLPGVIDTGFNPLSYTPNFSLLANSLDKATARYEANFDKLTQGYRNILESPIINDEKNNQRNNYLNSIKDQLKKISSTDLSIESNLNEAENLYSPFWEDKDMLDHIVDSKERIAQLEEQKRIAKEHPDYDNYTVETVMNYYNNKIKTSKNPNVINTTPSIKAIGLQNHPKLFQEWIKKNDWSQEFDIAQNGYIYKQKNGDQSVKSYNELFNMYLGNTSQNEYNTYGEYFKIQAIQDIKAKEKLQTGLDIDDSEAEKRIPAYYVSEQINNLSKQKKALETDFTAAKINSDKYSNDPVKLAMYLDEAENIQNRIKGIDSDINLLEKKGGDNLEDKKKYDELLQSVALNPTSFFANIKLNSDTELAAKMAASNQSLSVTQDQAYLTFYREQQQAAQWAQTHALEVRKVDIEEAKVAGKISGAKDIAAATGKVEYNSDGTIKSYENILPEIAAGIDNNKIEDAVLNFESNVNNIYNTGFAGMMEVFQSTKSSLLSDVLQPREASVIYKAYKESLYGDDYKKILADIKIRLKNKGVSDEILNNIKGPIGVFTAVADYYSNIINLDIKSKNDDILNKKPFNKEREDRINNNYADYVALSASREMINNAYAYKKEFDENINARIAGNPAKFKDITIKKKDGKYGLVTAQDLVNSDMVTDENGKKVKVPYNLMQDYVNGKLKLDTENIYDRDPYDVERFGRIKVGTNYNYTDPITNKTYVFNNVVGRYGTPQELRKKLDTGLAKLKESIPANVQSYIMGSTGKMGRTITYRSSASSEKDYADAIATQFVTSLNNYVEQSDDMYNLVGIDNDTKELLNESGIIEVIKSNPVKGLTSVKFHTIGAGDPSKRNITLTYDKSSLLTDITDKNVKTSLDKFDGSFTFELKDDADIKGFPKAHDDAFYNMLLSSDNKEIKQTPTDENVGLKYSMYKDADGNIRFKAGVQKVVVDDKNIPSYTWVNYNGNGNYQENAGYEILPPNVTVQDFILSLREGMLTQANINSLTLEKTLDPEQSLDYGVKKQLEELQKRKKLIFK